MALPPRWGATPSTPQQMWQFYSGGQPWGGATAGADSTQQPPISGQAPQRSQYLASLLANLNKPQGQTQASLPLNLGADALATLAMRGQGQRNPIGNIGKPMTVQQPPNLGNMNPMGAPSIQPPSAAMGLNPGTAPPLAPQAQNQAWGGVPNNLKGPGLPQQPGSGVQGGLPGLAALLMRLRSGGQ